MIHGPVDTRSDFVQQLLVYLPIVLFFVVYKLSDIFIATLVLMGSSTLLAIVERVTTGSIKKLHLWGTVAILILGGITVFTRDPQFIKWKLTLIYWAMGLVLLVSHLRGKKPTVQALIETTLADIESEDDEKLELTPSQWRGVNLAWAMFCIFIGVLNLFVAYRFSEDTWINFKLFGVMGLQFVFLVLSLWWMFSAGSGEEATSDE